MSVSVGGVRIPPEKMHLLNRTLDEEEWRMVPDEAGGGYVALLDVFHQIHCLVSHHLIPLFRHLLTCQTGSHTDVHLASSWKLCSSWSRDRNKDGGSWWFEGQRCWE
jgi:hypothetical protein